MKSTKEQLAQRGFLSADLYSKFLSYNKQLELLKSPIPTDRTLAARLLKNETKTEEAIEHLITALKKEKKLYPKIEISETLIEYGKPSVPPLITLLGKVGTNQHKAVPEKEFKKDSYPLPRDISSRILAHIGTVALPELLNNLETLDGSQLSEAIDAIGFICFYDYNPDTYEQLLNYYHKNTENGLIQWKIIRAMSAFPESENFLALEKQSQKNERLKKEIERSIAVIKKHAAG